MIYKLNILSLYSIISLLIFFSSDGFALSIVNKPNIYANNVSIMDLVCLIFILTGAIIIFYNSKKDSSFFNENYYKYSLITFFWIIAIAWGIFVSLAKGIDFGYSMILGYPIRYVLYGFIICLILDVSYKDKYKKVVNFFMIMIVIKSILGLANYFFNGGYSYGFLERIVFPFGDTLSYTVLGFSIAFNNLLTPKKYNKIKWILINSLSVLIFFSVVMLSMRRTYILGIFVVTIVIFALNKSGKRFKTAAIIIIISSIGCIYINTTNPQLFSDLYKRIYSINIFNSNNDQSDKLLTDNGHLDDTLDALDNLKGKEIVGNGTYTPVIRYRVAWQGSDTFFHIGIVDAWVKMGILGILVYFFTFFIPVVNLSKKIYQNKIDLSVVSIVAFLIGFFVQSFSEGAFYTSVGRSMILFILIGLVSSISKEKRKLRNENSTR